MLTLDERFDRVEKLLRILVSEALKHMSDCGRPECDYEPCLNARRAQQALKELLP